MTAPHDLAARIERADGPDRALDAEIATAVGWRVLYDKSAPSDAEPYYQPLPEMSWQAVLPYTASIDAAMQLVPEGYRVQLADWDSETLRQHGPWQAILTAPGGRDRMTDPWMRCDHAPTAAQALCAAALRAAPQAQP